MKGYFTIYDIRTGRIDRCGDITAAAAELDAAITVQLRDPGTEGLLKVRADRDKDYVDTTTGVVAPRPQFPAMDRTVLAAGGQDHIALAGLPPGTTVTVDATPHLIDDGEFQFSALVPGRYRIVVSNFPYLDYVAEVTAL